MSNSARQPGDEELSGYDRVIEFYKRGIDQTLLDMNLHLTVEQRILQLQSAARSIEILRNARRHAAD
jgi:hypothetical protein